MDGRPQVYHRCVAADEWIEIVDGLRDKFKFIYAEQSADLHFTEYCRPKSEWIYGRAFGRSMEVRWSRTRDGEMDLVLLTENQLGLQGWTPISVAVDDGAPLELEAGAESSVMLVGMHRRHLASTHRKAGEDVSHEWVETRIPHPVVYPLPETPEPERWAQLKVIVYWAAGRPVLTRMVDVEGTSHVERL